MDNHNIPQTPAGPPAPQYVPQIPQRRPFSAAGNEQLGALLMLVLAYVYTLVFFPSGEENSSWGIGLFTLGYVLLGELVFRPIPRRGESWLWLGCLLCVALGRLLNRSAVWGDWNLLFLHAFAVWWALCRSGALLEGESGSLLPFDGILGLFYYPFKHFALQARCLFFGAKSLRRGRGKGFTAALGWGLGGAGLGLVLLISAARLLMAADGGFAGLFSGLREWFSFHLSLDELVFEYLTRFLFSLIVGAYLFGLLAGTAREDKAVLSGWGKGLRAGMEKLRKVPPQVWTAVLCGFCGLYLLFFGVQARYLFGAFFRSLPEGFIVSEYARQGFFELCRVMAVNFVLLWLVRRCAAGESALNRALCLVLLGESLLLAVVAFSKLALYISCFGFTPKRLESTWLVCVLAFACLCWGAKIVTGKKTCFPWLAFAGTSLSLLCLV